MTVIAFLLDVPGSAKKNSDILFGAVSTLHSTPFVFSKYKLNNCVYPLSVICGNSLNNISSGRVNYDQSG